MPSAKLTSKGQITVPKEVRECLGLHKGDRVDFRIENEGLAIMFPASRKVSEVFGMLTQYKKKKIVSIGEMDKNMKKAFKKRRKMR